jgi:hypothetical protein
LSGFCAGVDAELANSTAPATAVRTLSRMSWPLGFRLGGMSLTFNFGTPDFNDFRGLLFIVVHKRNWRNSNARSRKKLASPRYFAKHALSRTASKPIGIRRTRDQAKLNPTGAPYFAGIAIRYRY